MKLGEMLDQVLESRKGRIEETGIALTERPMGSDLLLDAPDERLGQAVGHLVDTALRALAQGRERRLAVRTRPGNEGVIIEVEFPGGDLPESGPASLFGAYHSGEDRATHGLVKCRKLLADGDCRAYIGSGPRNAVRFVIEVPRGQPGERLLQAGPHVLPPGTPPVP